MILTTINTTSYFYIKGDFLVKQIKKRDGSIVLFQPEKIEEAIWKAVKSVGGTDREKVKEIAKKIVLFLENKFPDTIPGVEDIQDAVEKILIEGGHAKTAKAYILYRKTHQEIREATHMFDSIKAVDDYISVSDWLVNENSNMGFSLQGLNNYLSTKIISHYWLKRIYPEAVRKAHEEVDLHIHDLGTLGAYCVGWDLQDLLKTGFKGVSGKVASKPAKHFRTALGQMVNFFYTLQGESAGAQAFANVDTLLAPFIKYDNLDYKEVKQALQEFLFNLAVPTRVGFQCLSEDTDILTPEGWKSYDQLNKGDKIKTFNLKKKIIEDKVVNSIFKKEYNGIMYNLKNRIQDQLISPGHRVVRKKFQTEEYILEEIETISEMRSPFIIPITAENKNKEVKLSDEEIKLIAWIIAEGTIEKYTSHRHSKRITIYQSKIKNNSNYREIISILN